MRCLDFFERTKKGKDKDQDKQDEGQLTLAGIG